MTAGGHRVLARGVGGAEGSDVVAPESVGAETQQTGGGEMPNWFREYQRKVNAELADRRKAVDALSAKLEAATAKPAEAPTEVDRLALGIEIGALRAQLPPSVLDGLKEDLPDDPAALARALRIAAKVRATGGEMPAPQAGGEMPVKPTIRPAGAGGASIAGVPRTYAEFLKMPTEARAEWRARDPDGFARAADEMYRRRFEKP